MLQPCILDLNGLFVHGIDSAHLLEEFKLDETLGAEGGISNAVVVSQHAAAAPSKEFLNATVERF